MDQQFHWVHEPKQYTYKDGILTITTEPNTDYWQRTHYGFQNDNAPSFLKPVVGDFTFTVKTQFNSKELYDQCGLILYQGSEDWVKASSEYHTPEYSTLGSVVTNFGYSDWAFMEVPSTIVEMHYRMSRRGQDFLLEFSYDGIIFKKMRILHMHNPIEVAQVGVYACSPTKSSFVATFQDMQFSDCVWQKE